MLGARAEKLAPTARLGGWGVFAGSAVLEEDDLRSVVKGTRRRSCEVLSAFCSLQQVLRTAQDLIWREV